MAKTKPKKKRRLVKVRVDEVSLVESPAVGDSRFLVVKRDEGDAMTKDDEQQIVEEVVEERSDDAVAVEPEVASGEAEPKETEPQKPATEPEPVVVAKAADSWLKAIKLLRGSATDMDPSGLEMLANVIRYAMYRYGEDESVRAELSKMDIEQGDFDEESDDIHKALKVIGPSNFAKIEAAADAITESAGVIKGIAKSAKEIKKAEDGDEPESADEPTESAEGVAAPEEASTEGTVVKADETSSEDPKAEPDLLSLADSILKDRKAKAQSDVNSRIVAGLERIAERMGKVEERQNAFAEGLKLARGKV